MANPNVLNMRGTAAARPAAGIDGRTYWAYDTKAMSRDTGSAWETVTPAAGASGSILAIDGSGDLAFTPTLTQGDTFPVSPSDGDQHIRTDLGSGWVWDDTLGFWVGPELILMSRPDFVTFTADTVVMRTYVANVVTDADYAGLLITRWAVATNVDTTNGILDSWTVEIGGTTDPTPPTPGGLGLIVGAVGTLFDAPSVWVDYSLSGGGLANQVVDNTYVAMVLTVRLAGGAPGPIDVASTVYARALRTA